MRAALRFLLLVTCVELVGTFAHANTLGRDGDPVVMTGAQVPGLLGTDPALVVAFRYDMGWTQIPVQIDERAVKDYGEVYNSDPVGFAALAYADAGTFMGVDPDPLLDADDEIVFMSKDAGGPRAIAAADPAGVVPATRREILVHDPISAQDVWVYLFESAGVLTPDAGVDYVSYIFDLQAGPYLTSYNTLTGPNPENSQVTTAYYAIHFSDRWIRDETKVLAGSATGVDILDRHKNLFAPGNCARSEDTFSAGEGAFFVNKDGPVRAIRSYMGANSGPLTQRDHFFYERRHDVRTVLRVHAISGVMDFYDYSPDATGMVYYNDANPGGVTIDGNPAGDAFVASQVLWEMVTGAQGTLVSSHLITTTIPGFAFTSYWLDDATPSTTQCTGDASAYGSSGVWVTDAIPNTDPVFSPPPYYDMTTSRVSYMEPPDQAVALAEQRDEQARAPLTGDEVVPVAVEASGPVLQLGQNSPNPFAGVTRIPFAITGRATATIRVYDAAGRWITTLTGNGSTGAVFWNGEDAAGRRVPAGVYFYRMTARGETRTHKMVLVR